MDESFDVGVDTRYGVDDNDYQVPFRFTGKLTKLTIKLEPPKMRRRKRTRSENKRRKPGIEASDRRFGGRYRR